MMWCPNQECPDALELGSPAELRDDLTTCPFCGAELVASLPDWAMVDDEEAEGPSWVPILAITDDSWRPMLMQLLEPAGIRYLVLEKGARTRIDWGTPAGLGFNPTETAVLMVEKADAERANALLADFKDPVPVDPAEAAVETGSPAPATGASPSRCNACGKDLESAEGDEPLTYCYHCGAALIAID